MVNLHISAGQRTLPLPSGEGTESLGFRTEVEAPGHHTEQSPRKSGSQSSFRKGHSARYDPPKVGHNIHFYPKACELSNIRPPLYGSFGLLSK